MPVAEWRGGYFLIVFGRCREAGGNGLFQKCSRGEVP